MTSAAFDNLDQLENALRDLSEIAGLLASLTGDLPERHVCLPASGLTVLFSHLERCANKGVAAYERLPRR